MTKFKKTISYLAIILSCSIWGLSYLSSKYLLNSVHPMNLVVYRFSIAIFLILTINLLFRNKLTIHKSDLPRFIISGIFSVALYFTFENYGVKFTSAATASIIIASVPIISMLTDLIIMKNKVTLRIVFSTLLSFIGVFLVIDKGSPEHSSLIGILLMMFAAFSWVTYNYLTKPLFKKYSKLTITTYQLLFGTSALAPFLFVNKPDFNDFTSIMWLNLLFLGIFCSAIGYLLYIFALQNLNITITTLFINCIPLVTVSSSVLILNEHIHIIQILGGILIISAVLISTLKKPVQT